MPHLLKAILPHLVIQKHMLIHLFVLPNKLVAMLNEESMNRELWDLENKSSFVYTIYIMGN